MITGFKSAREWSEEASHFLSRCMDQNNFNRENEAKFNAMIRMVDLANGHHVSKFPKQAARAASDRRWGNVDAATRAFFTRQTPREPMISASGSCLEGNELRYLGDDETRTYAPLDSSTSGDAAGYTIPLGFFPEVIQRLQQYDQLFDCARWIFTDNGKPMIVPSADDVAHVATVLTENSPISQGANPVFSAICFPESTLWTTGQLLTTLQLVQDSPILYQYLIDAFARRFRRGIGASFIATLTSAADVGHSTTSPTAITPDDLTALAGSLDAEYGMNAGWLMNWSTWIAIRKLTTSNRYFIGETGQTDAAGHPMLFEKPVYISPSMDSLAGGKFPVAFGMMDRFVIRSVKGTQTVQRYDEKFMASHQIGWQAYWRVDAALANGSTNDKPIRLLRMPLS
jgi:HK97 family phage major capsid protein